MMERTEMTGTTDDRRLAYVQTADLERWQCRPLGSIDILDLRDRRVGHLDGVVIERETSFPAYLAVRGPTDGFLVPVGDAWFDETEHAVRIDAVGRERVDFDPEAFEQMSRDEAEQYERRVLANCCPEVGFHRDGRPDYAPQAIFQCPPWLRVPAPEPGHHESHRAARPRPTA
jgi:hypothetical protein